jgi:predicted cupin superfamily sugar epimerase
MATKISKKYFIGYMINDKLFYYCNMSSRIDELTKSLNMAPHPEGGFYKEVYRSEELIHSPEFEDSRSLLTSIYFLISAGNFSAFHRIGSDELWFYHEGAACTIHVLHQQGGYTKINLGNAVEANEKFQASVNAGDWFASETTGEYSLVGCAVAPGFDFKDFEIANRNKLILAFPDRKELIERLTRA